MAEDWTQEEVAAIVADYFVMLGHQLRGEPFNKREHNRYLQTILRGRSAGAVEFKHSNISAVLIQLGFPYIEGYKPRGNYQELLKDEVEAYVDLHRDVAALTQAIVDAPVIDIAAPFKISEIFVPPPVRERTPATYERLQRAPNILRNINYWSARRAMRPLALRVRSSYSTWSIVDCGSSATNLSRSASSMWLRPRAMDLDTISSHSTRAVERD